ncbi:hypothetical protein ACFVGY_34940 [Streptomyces sp. NPDC127106]|uniref:hypothetical protein n=1 Tax=Streptomyces sp. NPDC127106 TaxID=3345360 RepID=UPI00363A1EE1
MSRDSRRLVAASIGVFFLAAGLPAALLHGLIGGGETKQLTAVLTFIGVLVTASVSLIGLMVNHQAERRLAQEQNERQRQLRLDAAMRAGQLFSPTESGPAHPAAMASGLLALTRLDHSDLAVALLVDLWSEGAEGVSDETAILVIDAALRSASPNSQLVAAELLCRNARRLSACQSLHWPSAVDGFWNPSFKPKTKLLIIDALARMTKEGPSVEGALRSIAVRLYGIWRDDPDEHVRGCIGKLIKALVPFLHGLGYQEIIHGAQKVMVSDLERAAASAAENPDGYLDKLSTQLANDLKGWAQNCREQPSAPGALATAAV